MQNNIPCSPTSFHSIVKRISVEKCCHLSWHCGSTNDLALCASLSPTAEARSACNAHQTFASPAFCPAFHLFPYTALPGRHSSDCRCFDWNQFGCKSWSGEAGNCNAPGWSPSIRDGSQIFGNILSSFWLLIYKLSLKMRIFWRLSDHGALFIID